MICKVDGDGAGWHDGGHVSERRRHARLARAFHALIDGKWASNGRGGIGCNFIAFHLMRHSHAGGSVRRSQ